MELLEVAESKGSSKACHVNIIFKQLIDTLFPCCSVSRADHLMQRIIKVLNPIDSMSDTERASVIMKTWKHQPTSMDIGLSYVA